MEERIFNQRHEVIKNQFQTQQFYKSVIETVLDKICKKFRYSIDQQVIEKLGEATKLYLNQQFQQKRFMKCVRYREGTREYDKRYPELKIQQKSGLEHQLPHFIDSTLPKQRPPNFQVSGPTLARINRLPHGMEAGVCRICTMRQHYYESLSHINAKKKIVPIAVPTVKPAPQQTEDQSSQEEESDHYDPIPEAQQHCGALIYGTLGTNRHFRIKPKQGKINLDLQNVFIKFSNPCRDTFYLSAQLELTKKEKDQIPGILAKMRENGQSVKD